MDRFKDDFNKFKGMEDELREKLKERQKVVKAGQSTTKVCPPVFVWNRVVSIDRLPNEQYPLERAVWDQELWETCLPLSEWAIQVSQSVSYTLFHLRLYVYSSAKELQKRADQINKQIALIKEVDMAVRMATGAGMGGAEGRI